MFADDLAWVINEVIEKNIYENFNVATDETYSISEMVNIGLNACDSTHLKVVFDVNKPNGQYRKDVSINKLKSLLIGYNPIPLNEGIKKVYNNYDKTS
jgi:nucleoside-diphosphate-sugar epimerase